MRGICNLAFWTAFLASAQGMDFAKEVKPLLEQHCLDCHDRETLKGGIGLETYYHAHLPTDAGEPLFIPGKPEESVLLHVVEESDPEKRMPPKGKPLSSAEVKVLRDWIAVGAPWPDDGWRPPKHWSYLPPKRAPLPERGRAMMAGRHANEIDSFIVTQLDEQGLQWNPQAEPARLLRRLHLDVTGLPPTVEEVKAFEADPSFERYTQIVDELLADPGYGEKWAIPWLDLARYADSEGYQRDAPRTMWPWRDWVIQALNADMPFDQFSVEQLAGDLLPEATEAQRVASAFHRNAATNLEAGTDPKEDRYKMTVDRVNTTGTIWLGTTVGCAQCHNHKYDPLTTKEYYQLFAFFNQGPMETRQQGKEMGMAGLVAIGPTLPVNLTAEDQAVLKDETQMYRARLAELESQVRSQAAALLKRRADAVPEKIRARLESDDSMSLAECKEVVTKVIKRSGLNSEVEKIEIMADRLKAARGKDLRIMQDLPEWVPTMVAKRGDFQSTGEEVRPGTPASLPPFSEDLPRNRLGLARWLVSPENPLVGRAFINRMWQEVFGQGLVSTPEDFGVQGAAPTHPELLDWLAATFVQQDGWSMKQALRRILLSATYRQSVAVRSEAAEIDPQNTLLWRHPGQRLKAELIRDQALAISGLLSRRLFGPNVRPHQPEGVWRKTAGASETYWVDSTGENAHRRGIYTLWRRNAHYPSFANFDAPDRAACTVRRDSSNTPLQALTLLNDPAYVEMAQAFAQRIQEEGGSDVAERLQWAFRSAVARAPSAAEMDLLNETYTAAARQDSSDEAGWVEVATVLLNLHETLCHN